MKPSEHHLIHTLTLATLPPVKYNFFFQEFKVLVYISFTAQHLAEYLNYLDKNDGAYRSYFEWRFHPPGLALLRRQEPWCSLCKKLINPSVPSYYQDIHSWWYTEGQCDATEDLLN